LADERLTKSDSAMLSGEKSHKALIRKILSTRTKRQPIRPAMTTLKPTKRAENDGLTGKIDRQADKNEQK
jgi:hypothetical protein